MNDERAPKGAPGSDCMIFTHSLPVGSTPNGD